MNVAEEYRQMLVAQIKEMAKDLDEMAEDMVGNTDMITDFSIQLNFKQGYSPTILLVREHIGKHSSSYFVDWSYKEG